MRTRFQLVSVVAVAICFTTGSASDAQTLAAPAPRPGQGVFDRTPQGDQNLDLSVSLLGAFDNNLVEVSNSGVPDPRMQQSGLYSGLTTNVGYAKRFRHVELGLSEGSALRYYPRLSDIVGVQHTATAGVGLEFGSTRVNFSQTFGYLPFFAFVSVPRLFDPGLVGLPPATSDQVTVRREERLSGSAVAVTQPVGGRTSLGLSASLQNAEFVNESTGLKSESVGGRLSRHVTRDMSLVAGYTYQQGTYRLASMAPQVTRLHNIDLGIDYSHALGPTHRTTIGFTTGSSAVQDAIGTSQYRLTGSARLNREIGRAWHATAAYNRGVGFVDGFPQPFFADSFAASLGGIVDRRVELSFAGSYSTGHLGLSVSSNKNENYNSSARVRVALSHYAAISGEYLFYHYRFDQPTALPQGFPPSLNRQGARIGLDLWLPLIR